MQVTPECYARLTHMLCGLAEGRVIMALEGGYNLTSISSSFAACAHVLLGGAPPRFDEPLKPPHPGAIDDINKTIEAHKHYWRHLIPLARPTAVTPLAPLTPPTSVVESGRSAGDSGFSSGDAAAAGADNALTSSLLAEVEMGSKRAMASLESRVSDMSLASVPDRDEEVTPVTPTDDEMACVTPDLEVRGQFIPSRPVELTPPEASTTPDLEPMKAAKLAAEW
jgi:hypothetical protein